jgi:16S rRNA (guanine527-N7)-methyltransferase
MNKKQFARLSGIEITDQQFRTFEKLSKSFLDWNSKINVSAIKDEQDIWKKHFIDSVAGNKYLDFAEKKVLDLGTGGGFPLIPLAIINPKATFTGLDSVKKKLMVVQEIAKELNLKIPQTLHGRAEDFAHDLKSREKFDIVVTRAVAPWPTLLELTLPFVKIGGDFLAYQGPAIEEELKTYKSLENKLGAEIINVFREKIGENSRIFIHMKKIKATSKNYPREVGVPKKNPLK